MQESHIEDTVFFYPEESTSHATAAIVSVLFVLLAVLIVVFLMMRREQKRQIPTSTVGIEITKDEISVANEDGTYLYTNTMTDVEEAPLPSHISLHKDANLKEKSNDMLTQIESLEEEFFNLVEYVKENVKKGMNIATQGGNKEHNRYIDIGTNLFNFPATKSLISAPFDDNYICLKNEVFRSPGEVRKVEASGILFSFAFSGDLCERQQDCLP